MQTQENTGFLRKSEDLAEKNFTVKNSAKAFSILSNQLYTNKIRAIIRELSCNAYDAHVAAGNPDKFEIHLPSALNPQFKIRDFGTGLSPESVMSLYTTYFESTKTDSNDYIGALGLGSKSPFSYTDNFQVTSYWDGVKYSFAAFINENQIPCIAKVAEEPTLERNGLEISFAVNSKDFHEFKSEAEFVFYWFEKQPKIIGNCQVNNVKTTKSGNGWRVVSLDWGSQMKGAWIVMGNVAYRLDKSSIPNLSESHSGLLNTDIHFIVPIGAVEPAASREQLSLTKTTLATIRKVFDATLQELREEVQKKIDAAPSYWESILVRFEEVANIVSDQIRLILSNCVFEYKGRKIPSVLNGNAKGFTSSNYYGKPSSRKTWDARILPTRKTAYIINGTEGKARHWIKVNDKGFDRVYIVGQTFVDDYEISSDYAFESDNLPMPAKAATPRRKGYAGKKKNHVYVWSQGGYYNACFDTTEEVDFDTDSGVYVAIDKKRPLTKQGMMVSLEWVGGALNAFNKGYPDSAAPIVYGLTKTQLQKIENNKNWQHLEDYLKEKFKLELSKSNTLDEAVSFTLFKYIANELLWVKNNEVLQEVSKLLDKTHPIKAYVDEVEGYRNLDGDVRNKVQLRNNLLWSKISDYLPSYTSEYKIIDDEADKKAQKKLKEIKETEKQLFIDYPILGVICGKPVNAEKAAASIVSLF